MTLLLYKPVVLVYTLYIVFSTLVCQMENTRKSQRNKNAFSRPAVHFQSKRKDILKQAITGHCCT